MREGATPQTARERLEEWLLLADRVLDEWEQGTTRLLQPTSEQIAVPSAALSHGGNTSS